jgi:autophagy-related protein 101
MANLEQFTVKQLRLELHQVKDALKALLHSILFQRELGIVTPRQVESECGVSYLTLGDITTDKYIEERLALFESRLRASTQLTVALSFYELQKRKGVIRLFNDSQKSIWEEWRIPVQLVASLPDDRQRADAKLGKKLRKRLMQIIEHVCEKKDHLPAMGEPDSPEVIRYKFEVNVVDDPDASGSSGLIGKFVPNFLSNP